jgi:predicted XRE-type DNA-binding protein
MTKQKNEDIQFEKGTGSVFADLGLADSEELIVRAQIGFYVFKIVEVKNLRQREIAAVLNIPQPEVSHLMNGHYSRFTTDKLLDFLKRLDQTVSIQIRPHSPGEVFQEVFFTSARRHYPRPARASPTRKRRKSVAA